MSQWAFWTISCHGSRPTLESISSMLSAWAKPPDEMSMLDQLDSSLPVWPVYLEPLQWPSDCTLLIKGCNPRYYVPECLPLLLSTKFPSIRCEMHYGIESVEGGRVEYLKGVRQELDYYQYGIMIDDDELRRRYPNGVDDGSPFFSTWTLKDGTVLDPPVVVDNTPAES